MLSLKEWNNAAPVQPSRELLDLPDELLDLIVNHLFSDGGGFIRDVLASSLTCHRLRKAVVPILFHSLSIRLTYRYVDRRSFNILLNLDLAPHTFASQIRQLKQDDSYVFRAEGCEDLRLSNELVRGLVVQGLKNLSNVRSISVGCCNSALLHLMREAFPDKAFQVTIEGCICSRWVTGSGSLTGIFEYCESPLPHTFALALDSDERSCDLEPFMTHSPTQLQALSWTNPASFLTSIDVKFAALTRLEELHLREPKDRNIPNLDSLLPLLPELKRLSLLGSSLVHAALKTVSQLTLLESLRLHSTIDRIFHAHLHNHTFSGLPYLHLPNLQSLEIRYISRYLSIEHIVPQSHRLTHLRLEYHNRNERLTSYDLRWIATAIPNLQTLELNVGSLSNLWHPTAIAGVDVDIDVYGMLEALSTFPHLSTLRMFPSYWQSAAGYLHFVQPISDEQAVRIFHHLRPRCTALRVLYIANSSLDYRSRNEVFSRGLNGEPVKWMVREMGAGKTVLVTHEARKARHSEEVWEGERRLRSATVRHGGVRGHFDELGSGWILSAGELLFDERGACVTF